VRYLSRAEIIELHRRVIERFGGSFGIRDRAALDSSLAQPLQAFGGEDLYVGVVAKAAALGFFLATNHAFIDGNKRVAHAAMEMTLLLNGLEIDAAASEQEHVMLQLAAGQLSRAEFAEWVEQHIREFVPPNSA
jgi:death-on-curing protein